MPLASEIMALESGIAVCKGCIYDFLNECSDFENKYTIGDDVITEDDLDEYLLDHIETYEKPDDDPRYEPEYWER